jgi:Tfp pilus assembly protein PilN
MHDRGPSSGDLDHLRLVVSAGPAPPRGPYGRRKEFSMYIGLGVIVLLVLVVLLLRAFSGRRT